MRAGPVRDLVRRVPYGGQPGHGHLQRRLVRLVLAAERVVPVRAPRHLDVAAEHVTDRMRGRELDQPVQARRERPHVLDVQPAGVDGVAGKQEPGRRVVNGDRGVVVPGRTGDAQFPAAEVERDDLLRPVAEAEEPPHARRIVPDDHGARPVRELSVTGHMVAVPVGVRDDELVGRGRLLPLCEQPVDGLPHTAIRHRPGVEQQRPLRAAQQVKERALVVEVLALAHDERAVVHLVHLDRRVGGAARRGPVNPPHAQLHVRRRQGQPFCLVHYG